MSKEMTIYKNELNTVPFRSFIASEMDLFFSICSKMKNQGLQKIRYSFDDLKILSSYKNRHKERFIKDLEKTYSKMVNLTYRFEDDEQIKKFVLFTDFIINKKDEYVEISVNPSLKHILNEITGNFTKFELQEFTELNSSYSKTAFRLLKQFRLTGFWKVKIEDFRELLDIPKSYRMRDIDVNILKPITNELSLFFEGLKIKKIKAKKKNKIEYLEFSFIPQDDIRKDGTKIFKDNNDNYYENDIEHFTREEVSKSFPAR